MWTAANRKSYERKGLRYPSDMTEAEWALVKSLVDVPQRGQGRRREVDLREVLNAVFYILETGCQWRALPRNLPPRSTVHDYFIRWQCDRTLVKLHHELYVQAREQAGKEASPTTAIVDSQSVKSAERGAKPRIRSVTMPARVRLDGAHHLWRKVPSRELSIDLEADERRGWATGRVEAS